MRLRLIVTALALLPLAACGDGETGPSATPTAAPTAPASASPAAAVTATDMWVKTADKGMSAAFGTLANTTGREIVIVSAATPASPMVELHEVVGTGGEMKMQPKSGGFAIPAHGSLELKPGGYHIMLMNIAEPIEPGDGVAFTLKLKDGSEVTFTALAKTFNGGNETYRPGH